MLSNSSQPLLVTKRLVFHVGGYEPLRPIRIYGRFERELDNFRRTWNVTATLSPMVAAGDDTVSWHVESAGPNWRVENTITLLDWSEIVIADFARQRWRVILQGIVAMLDFLVSGAVLGYLRTNWRYYYVLIHPLFLLGLLGVAGFLVARFLMENRLLPWPSVLGPLVGVACVGLQIVWAGRRLHLDYSLLNWSFAADIVHRRRSEYEIKLDRLAQTLAEHVRNSAVDEIVVFSHSLGAVLMMQIVARALRHDPQSMRLARINLVSAGSSILKVGFHPAAKHFRTAVREVTGEPAIYWVEYQANADVFNFYKTDPTAEMGLPACGKPIIRIARIRHMVTDARYRRMRWNLLWLHLAFVMGNERRYPYDFFMICCGPLPLQTRVERPYEAIAAFAGDGTYLPPRSIVPHAAADPGGEAIDVSQT